MGTGRALIEIVNESGKLDLNTTGPEQLERLLEARGLETADATDLAIAINHWRSPPAPMTNIPRPWISIIVLPVIARPTITSLRWKKSCWFEA